MSSDPPTTTTREQFLAELTPSSVHSCSAIDEDTACVICTSQTVDVLIDENDEHAVPLHGTHVFGETCIRRWLATNNTCPKCRAVLFDVPAGEQEDGSESDDDDDNDNDNDNDNDYDIDYEMAQAMSDEVDYVASAVSWDFGDRDQINGLQSHMGWLRDVDPEALAGDEFELMKLYFDCTPLSQLDPKLD